MKSFYEYTANAFQYILTVSQTKEIFQIISLCLSIITTLVIMGSKVYNWWRTARADGKLTKEEVEELHNILTESIEEIKGKVNKPSEKEQAEIDDYEKLCEEADEYLAIVEAQEDAEKEVK